MKLIIPIITFLFVNSIAVVLFKKQSFSSLFPLTLMVLTIVFYLFGIINNLMFGYYFVLILAFIGAILIIYYVIKHNHNFIKRYFDIGFFAVISIYLLVCIIDFQRGFNHIDEFTFWGSSVEEIMRNKKLYIVSESGLLANKDYLPFYSIFESLWCFLSQGFSEAYCYRALSFFSLSLFIPLFELIKNKKIFNFLLLVAIVIISGLVVGYTNGLVYNALFYNSIYIDWHIAFLMAYCLFLISCQNKNYDINLVFALSSLVLTKQASVIYWLFLLIIYLILTIRNKEKINNVIYIVIISVSLYMLWKNKIIEYNIAPKFSSSDFEIGTIIKYFAGTLSSYRMDIISKFIKAIIFEPIVGSFIKLSYLSSIIIITVILIIIEFFYKRKNGLLLIGFYFIGAIIYSYSVLLAYLYTFDYVEAIALTMFTRYILLYVIFGIIYLLYCFISFSLQRNNYAILLCFVYLSFFISKDTIISSIPAISYNGMFDNNNYRFKEIVNNIDKNSKVIIISQNDPVKLAALKYYGIENIHKIDSIDIYDGSNPDKIGTPYWKKDLLELFKNYDYVYICDIDDSIYNLWSSVTDLPCKDDHMYKIEEVNDEFCKMSLLYEDF